MTRVRFYDLVYICSFFFMRRSGVDEQAEFEAAVKLCPPRVRSELVSRLDPAACHALLCERLEGFAEGRPPIRHKGQDAADPPTWRRVTAAALGAEEGCEPVALVRQWLIGVPQALGGDEEDEEARAAAEERAAQQRAREPHEEETAPADAAGQRRLALRGTPPVAPPPAPARAASAARRQADEAAEAARAAAAEQRADAHSDKLGRLRTEAEAAAAEQEDADAELAAAMEAVRAGKARAEDRKAKARQALSALEGAQSSLGAPPSPPRLGEGGGDFAALADLQPKTPRWYPCSHRAGLASSPTFRPLPPGTARPRRSSGCLVRRIRDAYEPWRASSRLQVRTAACHHQPLPPRLPAPPPAKEPT